MGWPIQNAMSWRALLQRGSMLPLAAAVLCAGCSSSKPPEIFGALPGATAAPELPPLLRGAAGMLLTNTSGFSARASIENHPYPGEMKLIAGDLFGRGSVLYFHPDSKTANSKVIRTAGISFIWDVAQRRGYVLSDALQGYAPISSGVQFTNVEVQAPATGAASEKIGGHNCRLVTLHAISNDGTTNVVEVALAPDLQGLPLRMASKGASSSFEASLSKARLEVPPDDLLLPPDSFTKYSSAEAMMNEISMRQRNLRARPSEEGLPSEFTPPQPTARPGVN